MTTTAIDYLALAKRALSHLDTEFDDRFEVDANGALSPLFSSLAEDAVFEVPCAPETPRYGVPARGKREVVELFLSDPEHFEDVEIERPLEYFGNGETIVVLFSLRYKIKKTGQTFRNKEAALVIKFEGDKIKSMREIQDMTPWCTAVSLN